MQAILQSALSILIFVQGSDYTLLLHRARHQRRFRSSGLAAGPSSQQTDRDGELTDAQAAFGALSAENGALKVELMRLKTQGQEKEGAVARVCG